MDFDFTEDQQDLQNLAKQILEGELTNERLREIDAGGDRFDRELWAKLAEAGLLGVAVPEAHGGLGYGFLEARHRARADRPDGRAGALPRVRRARRLADLAVRQRRGAGGVVARHRRPARRC